MEIGALSQKITKPIAVRHRTPMIYIERSKVHVKSNTVLASNKDGSKELSVGSTASIMLGPGTSITDEAVKIIARRDCLIMWTGGGGVPVNCIGTNYKTPKNLLIQTKIFCDDSERLRCAKEMLLRRNLFLASSMTPVNQEDVDKCENVQQVMLTEARWAKAFYRGLCSVNQITLTREKMKLANYFCYGLVTSVIVNMGFSPNLGIVHGANRGGGLIFDVADWIKPVISNVTCVDAVTNNWTDNQIKNRIIEKYNDSGFAKKIVDGLVSIYGLDN